MGIKGNAERFCRQALPWDLSKEEYDWRMAELWEPNHRVQLSRRNHVVVASTLAEIIRVLKPVQNAGYMPNQVLLAHTPEALVWNFFGPGSEDERTVPMAVFTDGNLRCYSETHDLTLGYKTAIQELCVAYGVECHITRQ